MENSEKRPQSDMISLFRQAATAMSAGVLLIIIGTPPQIVWIGFFFSILSMVLLVAALFQIIPKCHKFSEVMAKFNNELTILFILISLISVIRNWVAITTSINNASGKIVNQQVLCIQSFSSHAILYWVIVFGILFCIVASFDITRIIKRALQKSGSKIQRIKRICAIFFYVLGLWGFTTYLPTFNKGTLNLVLFILSSLVTIILFIYLSLSAVKEDKAIVVNDK